MSNTSTTTKRKSSLAEKFASVLDEDLKIVDRITHKRGLSTSHKKRTSPSLKKSEKKFSENFEEAMDSKRSPQKVPKTLRAEVYPEPFVSSPSPQRSALRERNITNENPFILTEDNNESLDSGYFIKQDWSRKPSSFKQKMINDSLISRFKTSSSDLSREHEARSPARLKSYERLLDRLDTKETEVQRRETHASSYTFEADYNKLLNESLCIQDHVDKSPIKTEKSPAKSLEKSPTAHSRSPGKILKNSGHFGPQSPVKTEKSPVKTEKSPIKTEKSPARLEKSPVKGDRSPPTKLDRSPGKVPTSKSPKKSNTEREERIQQYRENRSAQSSLGGYSAQSGIPYFERSPTNPSANTSHILNVSRLNETGDYQEVFTHHERASSLPRKLESTYDTFTEPSTTPNSRPQSISFQPQEKQKAIPIEGMSRLHEQLEIKEEHNEDTERPDTQANARSTSTLRNKQQSSTLRKSTSTIRKSSSSLRTPGFGTGSRGLPSSASGADSREYMHEKIRSITPNTKTANSKPKEISPKPKEISPKPKVTSPKPEQPKKISAVISPKLSSKSTPKDNKSSASTPKPKPTPKSSGKGSKPTVSSSVSASATFKPSSLKNSESNNTLNQKKSTSSLHNTSSGSITRQKPTDIQTMLGIKPLNHRLEEEINKKLKPTDNKLIKLLPVEQTFSATKQRPTQQSRSHSPAFKTEPSPIKYHDTSKIDMSGSFHITRDLAQKEIENLTRENEEKETTTFRGSNDLGHEYELFVKLEEATQKIHIKTFLVDKALRSILKPHPALLCACQALIRLFAGLDDSVSSLYVENEKIDWNDIKVLFSSPIRFINLISLFKEFAVRGEIPFKNIRAAEKSLGQVPENRPPQHEAFYQLSEFIQAAVAFYRYLNSNYASNQSNGNPPEPQEDIAIRQSEPPEKPESESVEPTSKDSQPKESQIPQPENLPQIQPENQTESQPEPQPENQGENQPESQEARNSATSKISNRKSVRFDEPKESYSPSRSLSPIINYFEENLQKGNETLRKLGEKKKELMRRVESLSLPRNESSRIIEQTTPGKSPNKKLDDTFLSKSASQQTAQKPSGKNRTSSVRLSLPDTKTEDETTKRRLVTDGDVSSDIIIQEEITQNEKEAREYRVRANKLIFEHEKYLKRVQKAKEQAQEAYDRQEELEARKRLLLQKSEEKAKEKAFLHQMKLETMIAKMQKKHNDEVIEKENQIDKLNRDLEHHKFKKVLEEKKKLEKKKELYDKTQNRTWQKLMKKKQEIEEQMNQLEELSMNRRKRLEWKRDQTLEEKKKWQSDYLLLSKMIGDYK